MSSNLTGKTLDAENKFKRLDLDVEKFKIEPNFIKYQEEFEPMRLRLKAFWSVNSGTHRMRKTKRSQPYPAINRLAFPIEGGYTTFQDPRYYRFITNLYNRLSERGIVENRLLVNHANLFPLSPNFVPYHDHEIPPKCFDDIKDFARSFAILYEYCQDKITLDQIKINVKKTTTMGWPFETADGQVVSTAPRYGTDKMWNSQKQALRIDWSLVKKTWLPKLNGMLNGMINLSDTGINDSNIVHAAMNLLITNNVDGFRLNSIDNPKHEGVYKGQVIWGKNRPYIEYGENGFEAGMIDVEKYAKATANLYPMPFAPQRTRTINVSSNPTGIIHQIDAQIFLKPIENSRNGFLSDAPLIHESYENFLLATSGMDLTFVSGDRINAELCITTNWEFFLQIIPPSKKKMMDVFTTHVKWTNKGPVIIKGLLSGIGHTTALNVMVGMYEACHTIGELTGFTTAEVSEAYIGSIINERDFFCLGEDFKIKVFLPTDDIPIVIAHRRPLKDISKSKIDERRMEVETSKEQLITFGMLVNSKGLSPSRIAQYSKLFYTEQPGYYAKDCFSVHSRFSLVDNMDLIDAGLRETYNIASSFFSSRGTEFLRDLFSMGISLDEVFSEFSPKDQIIKSQFVSLDPIFESQRVDPSFYEEIFEFLKR